MDDSSDNYYVDLFAGKGEWSGLYPNSDETERLGTILRFLGAARKALSGDETLRILDVGCGRGWLTSMVQGYGRVEGVEPVKGVVEEARRRYPEMRFHDGNPQTLLDNGLAHAYEIVICTEVIEHVPASQQEEFVGAVSRLLKPGGYAIVTTPRGKYRKKAARAGYAVQPVEDWLTEDQVRRLFQTHGLAARDFRRVFVPLHRLSFAQRLASGRRIQRLADRLRLRWLLEGARSALGFYQAWLFQSDA